DEAIVETAAFGLEGRAIRKVRQSVSRLESAGFSTELSALGSLTPSAFAELERLARASRAGELRGFTMTLGRLNRDAQTETLVLIARDRDRRMRGFLQFVPTFGRSAVSLSLMCREPGMPNGLTEFMVE